MIMQWLSSENFMGRLIELLSPANTGDVHTVVAELIKGIISVATPSPGAGLTEGLQNGPASNRFARELARRDSVATLVGYMLTDFGADAVDESQTNIDVSHISKQHDDPSTPPPPNAQSAASSVVHAISIIIELIRKNNSDYFEP